MSQLPLAFNIADSVKEECLSGLIMTRDAEKVCNVLLLKAADEKYVRVFQGPLDEEQQKPRTAFSVHFVDVLAFEYVNAEALASALRHLENYSGILVTSPRGAIAISNAVSALREQEARGAVLRKLRAVPIYSVGRATSHELDGLGVTCAGEESGSAEVLSEYLHRDGVLSEESKTKPMLFVCGEKRSDTLPASFRQRGLPIEELIVYRTCAVEQIELPEQCTSPDWVAFFSPSGLNAMKKVDLPWASVKKAAIGKTTATALQHYAEETGLKHWEATVVAAKPTPEGLAAAIVEYGSIAIDSATSSCKAAWTRLFFVALLWLRHTLQLLHATKAAAINAHAYTHEKVSICHSLDHQNLHPRIHERLLSPRPQDHYYNNKQRMAYRSAFPSRVPVCERARDQLRGGHDEPAGEHEAHESVHLAALQSKCYGSASRGPVPNRPTNREIAQTHLFPIMRLALCTAWRTTLMTTNAPLEALPAAADCAEDGAPSSAVQSMRNRLIAANVLMRYDYAWKEVEFTRADSRLTGVVSRLLYQYAMWQHLAAEHITDGELQKANFKVHVDANGYDVFRDDCSKACALMGFDVLDADSEQKYDADLVFIYIAPPGELRVDSQYATLEQFVVHHRQAATPVNRIPLFCLLKGEAAFLEPPHDDEAERVRGLSEFAISQQLHPRMQEAEYSSIAQFAVEFTPSIPNADHDSDVKRVKLEQLMSNFGCVNHNLMHYTEKWEFYAPQQSVFCKDDAVIHASDDDPLYWLEYAKDKTCHYCHTMAAKLSRCARCHDARYCSRDCQRSAWKFHKRLCGKTPEEISS